MGCHRKKKETLLPLKEQRSPAVGRGRIPKRKRRRTTESKSDSPQKGTKIFHPLKISRPDSQLGREELPKTQFPKIMILVDHFLIHYLKQEGAFGENTHPVCSALKPGKPGFGQSRSYQHHRSLEGANLVHEVRHHRRRGKRVDALELVPIEIFLQGVLRKSPWIGARRNITGESKIRPRSKEVHLLR